jgi:hypothetical protein
MGLMLLSWFMPWWDCFINGIRDYVVKIRPFGMWINTEALGTFASAIQTANMPVWFTPVMMIYMCLCVVALLVAIWKMEKPVHLIGRDFNLSRLLVGFVGLSYIVVAIIAVIVISIKAGAFYDCPLQGYFFIDLGDPLVSGATARLTLYYWLAPVVGFLLILISILRNKIVGKPKLKQ